MSRISADVTSAQTQDFENSSQAVTDLDLDQFLRLMITELQNQDPLNPLENSEMLQQLAQIREIGSNDKLANTLESVSSSMNAVLQGQNFATANGMIGKQITALDSEGAAVTGVVDRVSIATDEADGNREIVRLHVGDQAVQLESVNAVTDAQSLLNSIASSLDGVLSGQDAVNHGLDALKSSQNVATASGLVGKLATGNDIHGEFAAGIIEGMSLVPDPVNPGQEVVLLQVGEQTVRLEDIQEIGGFTL